jgi:hypothetical protein
VHREVDVRPGRAAEGLSSEQRSPRLNCTELGRDIAGIDCFLFLSIGTSKIAYLNLAVKVDDFLSTGRSDRDTW